MVLNWWESSSLLNPSSKVVNSFLGSEIAMLTFCYKWNNISLVNDNIQGDLENFQCWANMNKMGILGFLHDVIKIQTKKLSLLLSFYFHVILEHLKTFIQTTFRFKRVLCFAIQDAYISRHLRDAAFSWRPGKLLCGLKTLQIFGDFAI